MRTIGFRLVAGFLLILLLLVALALYSALSAQVALKTAIGQGTQFYADQILTSLTGKAERRVEQTTRSATRWRTQTAASNLQYERMADRDSYMDRLDREWSGSEPGAPPDSMHGVLENSVSAELTETFLSFFIGHTGSEAFVRALLTNRYGAVIAATTAVRRIRMDGQTWWSEARDRGDYTGAVELDADTGLLVIPIATRITDTRGDFAGVLVALARLDSIVQGSVDTRRYDTTRLRLLNHGGRLLYSTGTFLPMDDISQQPYVKRATGQSGSFVDWESGRETLYSYVRTTDPDWLLLVGHEAAEVLAPAVALRTGILIISAILVIAGLAASWVIARSITRPIQYLSEAVAEAGRGNLDREVPERGRDEIARLGGLFNDMVRSMRIMVVVTQAIAAGDLTVEVVPRSETDTLGLALRQMLENLRHEVGGILDAAGALATSTTQIFSAITQLAAASTESASAVGQTTATVEEVKQTSHLSNDKAAAVADRARHSAVVAEEGRGAVRRMGDLMSELKERMEAMAGHVLSLSERGEAIGEIVMSVSDLADQSRLLAVNAGIEAARAGEQGRGFSVVAQEIKDLAEESKKATGQVRTLLNDVHKAIHTSVLSMEQGTKATEAGHEHAERLDHVIEDLVQSIRDAADASTQIAASSHQQLVGMDQVAAAMEGIKTAAGDNAQSTKQLESEVQSLYELSQRLKKSAARYRVPPRDG